MAAVASQRSPTPRFRFRHGSHQNTQGLPSIPTRPETRYLLGYHWINTADGLGPIRVLQRAAKNTAVSFQQDCCLIGEHLMLTS